VAIYSFFNTIIKSTFSTKTTIMFTQNALKKNLVKSHSLTPKWITKKNQILTCKTTKYWTKSNQKMG